MEISNEIRAIEIHNKATAYFRTAEQYGYKFFMELKIIRDEKLFRILGFEDFEQYTLQNFNYSRNTMNERIQTAEAWGEEYNRALGSYGKHKTRQLGLMPEHDRQDVIEHGIPTDDGIKTVEDATTREIAKYQKQLKQKDSIIAQKDNIINRQFEQMQQQETQVIEKEVVPADYESLKQDNQRLVQELNENKQQLENLHKQRQETEEKSIKYDKLTEAINEMQGKMDKTQKLIQAQKQVYELVDLSKELLTKIAPIPYVIDAQYVRENHVAKRELQNIEKQTNKFLKNLRDVLHESEILEGEIIND